MGMLSTVINGLALMDCLEKLGVKSVSKPPSRWRTGRAHIKRRATRIWRKPRRHLCRRDGEPLFFHHDGSTPWIRDPCRSHPQGHQSGRGLRQGSRKIPDAVKYDEISYMDALEKRLNIMDSTAFSLCMDNDLPILVFSMKSRATQGRAR